MQFEDFLTLASTPAFKPGESKPSRPNLYMVAGNLQVYLPELGAKLLGGELLSDGDGSDTEGSLLSKLIENFRAMQRESPDYHAVNLWMGCAAAAYY